MSKLSQFIDKAIDRFGLIRKGAVPSALQSGFSFSGIGKPTPENYTNYLEAYTNESWVYICVYKIANTIAGLPIKIWKPSKKQGETFQEVLAHPFLTLLQNPNDKETQIELIESLVSNSELTGNGYLFLDEQVNLIPKKLYSLIASRITVKGKNKDGVDLGYKYKNAEIKKDYENEDIAHYSFFHPTSEYYGMSPIAAGRFLIEANQQANTFNALFFKQGAVIDGVLETEQKLLDTVYNRLKEQWKQRYTGTDKAHETAILEQGLKYKPTQLSQRDMEFIQGQKINRETICALFGVPPAIVGLFEYASYANAKEQNQMFWNDTIIPKLKKLRGFLQKILNRYGNMSLYLDFDLSAVESLRENEDLRSQIATRYFQIGISVNQIIEKLNLPFDPVVGGDRGYLPFNLMPIGAPKPIAEIPPAKTIKSITADQKRQKWDMMIKVTEALEKKYIVKINDFFSKQRNEVISNLNKYKNLNIGEVSAGINYIYELNSYKWQNEGNALASGDYKEEITKVQIDIDSVLFDYDLAVKGMVQISKPFKTIALEQAGKSEFELLNIQIAFDMSSASVIEYLSKHGLEQATTIIDTAKESVRTAIIEGLKEKETISQLAKRIQETYLQYTEEGIEGSSAMRIARTEMMEASNFGNKESYRQAGIEKNGWLTAYDESTCELCAELGANGGEIVKVGENFSNGEDQPPAHPRCRCTTFAVISEE